MKYIYIIPLTILTIFSLLFTSCDGCNGGDYIFSESTFRFWVLDKNTGKDLLMIGANIYDRDTVRVLNKNMKVISNRPVDQNGAIWVYPFRETDDGDLNKLIHDTLYLYFNHQDTDTIVFSYSVSKDECDIILPTQIGISYNDSVYYPLTTTSRIPGASFLK